MAQTTAQVSKGCGKVEVALDGLGVTFTNISGVANTVSDTEQTKITGEAYTIEGDGALIGVGKREPMELSVAIVYTETDAEGYEVLREHWEAAGCDGPLWLRWSPRGGNAGDEQLTTGKGFMTAFTYPDLDAASGDPIMCGFKIKCGSVATTIVAS